MCCFFSFYCCCLCTTTFCSFISVFVILFSYDYYFYLLFAWNIFVICNECFLPFFFFLFNKKSFVFPFYHLETYSRITHSYIYNNQQNTIQRYGNGNFFILSFFLFFFFYFILLFYIYTLKYEIFVLQTKTTATTTTMTTTTTKPKLKWK